MSEPQEYLVRWEIDAYSATPREAAQFALDAMRNDHSPDSATVFYVFGPGGVWHVDLLTGPDEDYLMTPGCTCDAGGSAGCPVHDGTVAEARTETPTPQDSR